MDMLSPLLNFSLKNTPPTPSPHPSFSRDSAPGTTTTKNNKDSVYVAAVPLRATPGPAQWILSAAYNRGLGQPHLQHYIVLVESKYPAQEQVIVFDFQPSDPENILTPLAVITQGTLPGVILQRKIQRIPKTKCWFVGSSIGNSLEIANTFNQSWSTDLIVGTNDCRHYTNEILPRYMHSTDCAVPLAVPVMADYLIFLYQ